MTALAAADRLIDRLPEPFLNWVADRLTDLVTAFNVAADRAARWAVDAVDAITRWFTECTGPEDEL